MIWELARAALFRLDPETAHRATFALLDACAPLLAGRAPNAAPVELMGLDVPQSHRPGRRAGQEWRAHRCAGSTGLRVPGGRDGDAPAAAGQPAAAPVPPAPSPRADQPHGLQQPRRGPAGAQRPVRRPIAAFSASTSARTSTRRSSARRPTTSRACARRIPWRATSPSIFRRRTPRICAGCRRRTSSTDCSPALKAEQAQARQRA